jgi:2-(1,2-epoxy-1,2-dihydrophenyl)acetyl-CoA isomerase
MTTENVLLELHDGVATLTLNRPDRLNAVDWDTAVRLIDLLHELKQRDDARAIVLTGAGRSFCAGGDLAWVDSDSLMSERIVPRDQRKNAFGPFAGITQAIVEVDKPIVAALHGHVAGVGLVYAMACDRRFADETVRASAIFVKRGMAPECGLSYFLPRLVGVPEALRLVTTGAWVEAEEAKRIGLVDELVPKGEALAAAQTSAAELARGPSIAVDLARRNIYRALNATLQETFDYELLASSIASNSEDAKEGVQAFLDKREAQFKGQ